MVKKRNSVEKSRTFPGAIKRRGKDFGAATISPRQDRKVLRKGRDKYFYSWEEFEKDTEKLALWAKSRNFGAIYGVPRGGVVVAISLSHRLNLPAEFSKEKIDEKTLLVDDISDSGKTILDIEKDLSFKPMVATIFYHEETMRKPDFCVRKKEKWVVFPWETEETSRYDRGI